MRRVFIGLVSGLLTLGLLVGLGIGWAVWTYQGPGPAARGGAENHVVVLRRGAGLNEIASSLEKAGAVRSAAVFVAAAQVTGAARALKAGNMSFPAGPRWRPCWTTSATGGWWCIR